MAPMRVALSSAALSVSGMLMNAKVITARTVPATTAVYCWKKIGFYQLHEGTPCCCALNGTRDHAKSRSVDTR